MMTTVNLNPPAGTTPSQINLRDGSVIYPNGVFPVAIPAQFLNDMLAAGWSIASYPGT
jgi:hypothetical protein